MNRDQWLLDKEMECLELRTLFMYMDIEGKAMWWCMAKSGRGGIGRKKTRTVYKHSLG